MRKMKQAQRTNYTSQKRFLRRKISELTFSEDWFNNPENLVLVQRFSKELEQLRVKEKRQVISDSKELNLQNYFDLKNIGHSDREIASILEITKYALHQWKIREGLTQEAIREFLEGASIGA